jgi:hypothetical protein
VPFRQRGPGVWQWSAAFDEQRLAVTLRRVVIPDSVRAAALLLHADLPEPPPEHL